MKLNLRTVVELQFRLARAFAEGMRSKRVMKHITGYRMAMDVVGKVMEKTLKETHSKGD